MSIAVIDYGMGNLRSVTKALEHVAPDQHVFLSHEPDQILAADRVVFPGQGAAGDCMLAIDQQGLHELIIESAKTKPFLGICMGMQVLVQHSKENNGTDCLGIFDGEVVPFSKDMIDDSNIKLKVPHMGWNELTQDKSHPLWDGIPDQSRFYFVHSYFLDVMDKSLHAGSCHYGHPFTAAIAEDNIFAMQCHPEKSAEHGLKLLENFTNWDGQS